MTRLSTQSRARPPVTPAIPARASLPGLPPLGWTQSGAGTTDVRDTFDNFNSRHELMKTGLAILALRVREVWQPPCLCPYVTERTHAEDLDH
jgi:hypothetical protein